MDYYRSAVDEGTQNWAFTIDVLKSADLIQVVSLWSLSVSLIKMRIESLMPQVVGRQTIQCMRKQQTVPCGEGA